MMHKITWVFDPGKTTGVAKFVGNCLFWWGEFTIWEEFDHAIDENDNVVYESIYWHGPAFNPVGLEVIGVIKFLCKKRGVKPTAQHPQKIVGIQKWPIYDLSSIKSPHAKDAIYHGIIYFKNKVKLPKNFQI